MGFWSANMEKSNYVVNIPNWLSRILYLRIHRKVPMISVITQIWVVITSVPIFILYFLGFFNDAYDFANIYLNIFIFTIAFFGSALIIDGIVSEIRSKRKS